MRLQISIDGGTEEANDQIRGAGHFQSVIHLLTKLKNLDYNADLRMTVTRKNQHTIVEFIELCKFYNSKPLLAFVDRIGRASDYWNEIGLSEKERIKIIHFLEEQQVKCGYPKSIIPETALSCPIEKKERLETPLIKTDGSFHPCQKLYENRFCIGNIIENSYDDLVNYNENEYLLRLSSLFHARKEFLMSVTQKCINCIIKDYCGGGCPSQSCGTNDFFGINDDCDLKKTQFLKNTIKAVREK